MKIDQYESEFLRAWKQIYEKKDFSIKKICFICDEPLDVTKKKLKDIETLFVGEKRSKVEFEIFSDENLESTSQLLFEVNAKKADLVIAERDLHSSYNDLTHGLSPIVIALSQESNCPLFLLPKDHGKMHPPKSITIATDHLSSHSDLVNVAISFATDDGFKLILCHVEDEQDFNRYMDAIQRIPEINTEIANKRIKEVLLDIPRNFANSVKEVLADKKIDFTSEISFGCPLRGYERLLNLYGTDLLVVDSKLEDKVAINGDSYNLAIVYNNIPILMVQGLNQ